jgi:hypothetical protein
MNAWLFVALLGVLVSAKMRKHYKYPRIPMPGLPDRYPARIPARPTPTAAVALQAHEGSWDATETVWVTFTDPRLITTVTVTAEAKNQAGEWDSEAIEKK